MIKQRGLFGIYGCDFMIDTNMKIWFIEANRSPAFQGTTEAKGRLQRSMLHKVMDLEEMFQSGGIEDLKNFNLDQLQPILYVPEDSQGNKADLESSSPRNGSLGSSSSNKHGSEQGASCGETYFGLFSPSCTASLRAVSE
eukprot:CAMPEP_0185259826 /NCGR_PEP_ID=MMETSP1359-20130426/8525_1 /TAXON_ID=552665 /ORGANISM="Bigelowiella longifila, Strain CCMP242" /LENGTH=139 /DNA_ID=CAMNT_0027845869 /DNA_START=71 /DNA_END=490 /DNA_ORIENTATION=-